MSTIGDEWMREGIERIESEGKMEKKKKSLTLKKNECVSKSVYVGMCE